MLYGNFFVFLMFQGKTHIDEWTRNLVNGVLTAVCGAGVLLLVFLRPSVGSDGQTLARRVVGPVEAFVEAIKLFGQKEMILLCFTFLYTGECEFQNFIPARVNWY